MRLWDYVNGRPIKTYQGHVNQKYSICGAFGVYGKDAFEPAREAEAQDPTEDAKWAFVVSGSEDGTLLLWDVVTKNVLQQLRGHEGPVLGVDTHPSHKWMVSAGLDKTIRVWICDEEGEEFAPVEENSAQQGELVEETNLEGDRGMEES